MPVAYETGVASDPIDLLEKLETFASANGWTSDAPLTAESRVLWNNTGGQVYASVLASATTWQTRGALGVDTGQAWNTQPGISSIAHTVTWGAGPFIAYHFFIGSEAGRNHIHVVVEIAAGRFRHWTCGELVPAGVITGGTYFDSIHVSTTSADKNESGNTRHRYICDARCAGANGGHIWIDYDGKVDNWQPVEYKGETNANYCLGSFRTGGILDALINIGSTKWAERLALQPLEYFANRASGLRSRIGRIPNMRGCNLRNNAPGDLISVGGQTWQVFPPVARYVSAPADGTESSGLYGYAYLRP